jgi:hypothetical protein
MNQEIWIYRFTVADTADLSTGADVGLVDLSAASFTRITNTPASRAPSPGGTLSNGFRFPPFIADDNRDATINDNGTIIAFTSTRDLTWAVTSMLGDRQAGKSEIFIANITTPAAPKFSQVTNTVTSSFNNPIFSSVPNLSGDGSVVSFISNANLTSNNDDGSGLSNGEIYVANYNAGAGTVTNLRQVTKTKNGLPVPSPGVSPDPTASANFLTFGRRISRDGRYVGFESATMRDGANTTLTAFRLTLTWTTFHPAGTQGYGCTVRSDFTCLCLRLCAGHPASVMCLRR